MSNTWGQVPSPAGSGFPRTTPSKSHTRFTGRSVSNATQIELPDGGFTHNLVFFVNVVLAQEGLYWVQTLLDSEVVDEVPFAVVLHQHDFA